MRVPGHVPPCPRRDIRDRIPLSLRHGTFRMGRVEYITAAFPRTGALAPPPIPQNIHKQAKLQFTAGDESADAQKTEN